MNPRKGLFILILALLMAIPSLQAQQQSEPPVKMDPNTKRPIPADPVLPSVPPRTGRDSQGDGFYRLDFVIREMDGEKAIETRNYSMWLQADSQKTVKAVSEVRVPAGNSVNIKTIGVSISCYVRESEDQPWLNMNASLTDMMPPGNAGDPPVFRNIGMESMALLSLGKSVTVSKVEDPITKHRFQVDVTGTKLK